MVNFIGYNDKRRVYGLSCAMQFVQNPVFFVCCEKNGLVYGM